MWEGKLSLIVGSEQVRCIFEDSQENVIRYLKFATSHEETGVNLSFSLISFKMEFNPLTMRQPKQSNFFDLNKEKVWNRKSFIALQLVFFCYFREGVGGKLEYL